MVVMTERMPNKATEWSEERVRDVIGKAHAYLPNLWVSAVAAKVRLLREFIADRGFNPDMPGLGVRAAKIDSEVANAAIHVPSLLGALSAVANKRMAIKRGYKRADPRRYALALHSFLDLLRLDNGKSAI